MYCGIKLLKDILTDKFIHFSLLKTKFLEVLNSLFRTQAKIPHRSLLGIQIYLRFHMT